MKSVNVVASRGYLAGEVVSADSTKIGGTGKGFLVPVSTVVIMSNQLGVETVNAPKCPEGSFWFPATQRVGASAGDSTGVLKGPNAGFPLLTAAESHFLQAEAMVAGIVIPGGGSAASHFDDGIAASFQYLYQLPDKTYAGNYAADAATYIADNNSSYLVNFSLASSADQKIEAIITQKYIALNYVNSQEGWNDYRRTGYPIVSGTGATRTFASIVSQSTRPDRLPTRILYPSSEAQYNPANNPGGISPFTSTIFWAK